MKNEQLSQNYLSNSPKRIENSEQEELKEDENLRSPIFPEKLVEHLTPE